MSYQYTYNHPVEVIWMDLEVGTVDVKRADPETDQPLGATLVLHQGDVLTSEHKIVHTFLTPVEEKKTPENGAQPRTRPARKKPTAVKVKPQPAQQIAAEPINTPEGDK